MSERRESLFSAVRDNIRDPKDVHHRNCATQRRLYAPCDCYYQRSIPAHDALDALETKWEELRYAVGSALLITVNGETKMTREAWLRIEAAFLAAGIETPEVAIEPPEDSR